MFIPRTALLTSLSNWHLSEGEDDDDGGEDDNGYS